MPSASDARHQQCPPVIFPNAGGPVCRSAPANQGKVDKNRTLKMVCCKCNKSVHCRNCACVTANKSYHSCLPSRLNQCSNHPLSIPSCSTTLPTSESISANQPHATEDATQAQVSAPVSAPPSDTQSFVPFAILPPYTEAP